MIRRSAALAASLLLALVLSIGEARAQQPAVSIPTTPIPIVIAAGNTFQLLKPAGSARSLTIQNNNTTTDNCWILIGGPWQAGDTTSTSRTVNGASMAAPKAAILLTPGQPYTRGFPYTPADQILGTCASSSDSIYADIQ